MRRRVPSPARSNSTSSIKLRISFSPQPRRPLMSEASLPLWLSPFWPLMPTGMTPRLETVTTNLSLSTRKR